MSNESQLMTNAIVTDPYASLSLLKRIARPILIGVHRVLPQCTYDALYHPAFAAYQHLLRWRYQAKITQARRQGNQISVIRMERVRAVMPYSLIGSPGLEHTHDLAQELVHRQVEGAFVECGVAQGGCAALIGMIAAAEGAGRHCWFFDSFEGLPDPTNQDYANGQTGQHIRPLPRGSCLGTYEQVLQLLLGHFELTPDCITLIKGWFQNTLSTNAERVGPIALLRIDGDWYESTKSCLETFYDQVSDGGQIIIDDYCSCYGARKATDEFIRHRQLKVTLVPDGRGGCSFKKTGGADTDREQRRQAA